ncbi:MAG: hypothetical protein ACI9LM_002861 [Alteromonadaceae bacterium]|jgi:hypothetical protein
MKLTSINIFLATLLFSQSSSAALKTYENTWFEIEVILFSQLGDRSRSKEVFPDSSTLPHYPKIIDLLGPYLQPDILSLKQLLPSCQQVEHPLNLINQTVRLPSLFTQKALTEMSAVIDGRDVNSHTNADSHNNITTINKPFDENSSKTLAKNVRNDANNNNGTLADSTRLQEQYILNSFQQESEAEQTLPLTQEQIALVIKAEQHFSALKFNYSPKPFATALCTIEKSLFDRYQQTQPGISYAGFPVDSIGVTIDGTEDYTTTQPYLLNENSLKLKDIVGQLRRSHDFKPLLHLGWRQITKLKELAIPVHLFAGDNLNYHYQKSLALYQQQRNESLQQEQTINNILFTNQQTGELTAEEQAIKEQITFIVEQADLDDKDLTKVLNELDIETLAFKSDDSLMLANKPLPPVQAWSIEGFLKIEVSRYLHLTADFNVVDSSLAEQATKRLQPNNTIIVKPIRFQQNKRMRSNEIHYFDHPYMGMIVQIRRHKQSALDLDSDIDGEDFPE